MFRNLVSHVLLGTFSLGVMFGSDGRAGVAALSAEKSSIGRKVTSGQSLSTDSEVKAKVYIFGDKLKDSGNFGSFSVKDGGVLFGTMLSIGLLSQLLISSSLKKDERLVLPDFVPYSNNKADNYSSDKTPDNGGSEKDEDKNKIKNDEDKNKIKNEEDKGDNGNGEGVDLTAKVLSVLKLVRIPLLLIFVFGGVVALTVCILHKKHQTFMHKAKKEVDSKREEIKAMLEEISSLKKNEKESNNWVSIYETDSVESIIMNIDKVRVQKQLGMYDFYITDDDESDFQGIASYDPGELNNELHKDDAGDSNFLDYKKMKNYFARLKAADTLCQNLKTLVAKGVCEEVLSNLNNIKKVTYKFKKEIEFNLNSFYLGDKGSLLKSNTNLDYVNNKESVVLKSIEFKRTFTTKGDIYTKVFLSLQSKDGSDFTLTSNIDSSVMEIYKVLNGIISNGREVCGIVKLCSKQCVSYFYNS